MDTAWRNAPTAQYDMKACGTRITLCESDDDLSLCHFYVHGTLDLV